MAALPPLAHKRSRFRTPAAKAAQPSTWIQAFISLEIVCQLALLSSALGPFRIAIRVAAFGASLLLLFFLRGHGRRHPASGPAYWVLAIVGLSIFHPTTNTLLAGSAHAAMYLAILAPLFWVPRLQINAVTLRQVMLILWLFHSLSAGVGVLQVYFPGQFQPNLSSVVADMGEMIGTLYIETASGERVFRPMGLTDVPGGAATAGFYAVLLGMGFILVEPRLWFRIACVASMLLGIMCIYLSQVRSIFVLTVICLLALGGVLFWRGQVLKLSRLGAVMAIVIVGGFTWAISLGGESVTRRLTTLIKDQPAKVYYANRGIFLEDTINELLPQYPLGAGLGRWGMMNNYFGDNFDPERSNIWVEIQWTGWLLDGGVPLIVAYVAALALALRTAWRIARSRAQTEHNSLWLWGAVIVAYDLGAFALTFNYPLFMGQGGLEFWLLNAALFASARATRRQSTAHPKPRV